MNIKTSSSINPAMLFLLFAILIGGYVRLNPVLGSAFPLNDGGLFYTMTQDLQANQYNLPESTSYNQLELPYVYPPLPFYFAGLLADLSGWELIDIFRFLPVLFTILTIPAFFCLAQDFSENQVHVGIATLIFALLPTTFDWLIMGGGLTRAPAFFFALLTLHCIYLLYTRRKNADIVWTSLLAALTILCHPETALHTAISALVFFLFFGRSKAGMIKSFSVAGLVTLLTSVWWIPNLVRHGLDPYLAAGRTGWHSLEAIVQLFRFDMTNEYGLATIGVLALLGLFWLLARRKFFLPVWLLVIFLSEPRSAPLYITPIMALLAGYSLINILSLFNTPSELSGESAIDNPLSNRPAMGLFGLLFAQWLLSALAITAIVAGTKTLTVADQAAFDWIVEQTPRQARFLILSGDDPFSDPTSEWFPALTERISVATVQGYEWDKTHDFDMVKQRGREIQNCYQQTPACIQDWMDEYGMDFDYIYLRKLSAGEGWNLEPFANALEELLTAADRTSLVYQSPEVAIFSITSAH